MNNNYEELDYLHENAKILSGGNRFAYLAIMIAELVVCSVQAIILKAKNLFRF